MTAKSNLKGKNIKYNETDKQWVPDKKVIPELFETEEPEMKTPADIKAELAAIEAAEALEDAKADELELDEGEEVMSDEEIALMTDTKPVKAKAVPVQAVPRPAKKNKPVQEMPGSIVNSKQNLIDVDKTMLYNYPTTKEWDKIHEIKPKRIIFYFTMSKEEYKALFLCQVRYQTKIIGSTGARVI